MALQRAENWRIGGNKVMYFDGKLNLADTEGRKICIVTTFSVLYWAIEGEKYDLE